VIWGSWPMILNQVGGPPLLEKTMHLLPDPNILRDPA